MPRLSRRAQVGLIVLMIGGLGAWLAWGLLDPWPARLVITTPPNSWPLGFSPDGRIFETRNTTGQDSWDVQTGQRVGRQPAPYLWVRHLSPDGCGFLGTLGDGLASPDLVWGDAASRTIQHQVTILPRSLRHLSWGDNGHQIRAIVEDSAQNWEVVTWDAATAVETRRPLHGPGPSCGRPLAHTVDGRVAAYIDKATDSIQFWDTGTDSALGGLLPAPTGPGRAPGRTWTKATFAPDGQTLALSRDDHRVELWDVPGLRLRRVVTVQSPEKTTLYHDFSPDGRLLVTTGGPREPPTTLQRVAETLSGFLTTSNFLTARQEVVVFDLRDDRVLARLPHQISAGFAPDGQTLATFDPAGRVAFRAVAQLPSEPAR